VRDLLKTGRFWAFAATLSAMFFGFAGMFSRAAAVFRAPEEDMGYAWYVPLFSLYVLWTQRDKLREAVSAPDARHSWLGFVLCLPCLALALLGARGLQIRFEQIGFIGLLIALPWTFYGRRTASLFVFPALYLAFTIPVAAIMDMFTIHLRLLASGTALAVLNGCGLDAVREGTAIVSHGTVPFAIDVAEPCSGLRSLMALMALTAAYAWYTQPTWPRRVLLFATAIPLAILGNVMRILTICIVAASTNPDFALGFYHDYSGYVVFIVAISLMVACGEGITRLCAHRGGGRQNGDKNVQDAANGMDAQRPAASSAPAYLASAVFIAAFVYQGFTPSSMIMEAPEVALPAAIPDFTVEEVRYCQNEQCAKTCSLAELNGATNCPSCGAAMAGASLGELTILPSDTRFVKRLYLSASGHEYLVSAVIGGASKRSIHRPELCLPGQGFTLLTPREIDVNGHPFRVIKVLPPRSALGSPSQLMAYTFFNQEGFRTSSHVRRIIADTWDRTVFNRVDRWVMVTIHAAHSGSPRGFDIDDPAEMDSLRAFLGRLAEVLP